MKKRGRSITMFLAITAIEIIAARAVAGGTRIVASSKWAVSNNDTPGVSHSSASVDRFLTSGRADVQNFRRIIAHSQQEFDHSTAGPSKNLLASQVSVNNPFEPPESASNHHDRAHAFARAQNLMLQAVLDSTVAPVCVINNTLVRQGQSVDGFAVQRIDADAVEVSSDGFKFQIKLLP